MKSSHTASLALCALLAASGTAQAALIDRGGGLIYDTDLDVTWVQNAGLAITQTFGVSGISGNGWMSWNTAQIWIGAMNAANYLNYNNWRLPTVKPISGVAFNYNNSYIGGTDTGVNISEQGTAYAGSTSSEMAHLFYNSLNNKGACDPALSTVSSCVAQTGYGLVDKGPFTNFLAWDYLYGMEFAPNTSYVWDFRFTSGTQSVHAKTDARFNVLVVRSGDVTAVPTPAAAWLLGSGLLGLMGVARRKAT